MEEIIEFDDGSMPEGIAENYVSAKEILAQHRKRWAVKTSKGTIVLKKATKLESDAIAAKLLRDGTYQKLVVSYRPLWEKYKSGVEMEAADMDELIRMGEAMSPYMRPLMLACIVEPKWIRSVEDLDALLSVLEKEEADMLYQTLTSMITPEPDKRVAGSTIELAKRFGISMPKDLDVENMTVDQATVMQNSLVDEARELKKVQQEMLKNVKRGN